MNDAEIENLLRKAKDDTAVPPRPGLAERIIRASQQVPQRETGIADWLGDLLRPKPAFALACLLVIGMLAGFWMRSTANPASATSELAGLLYSEEKVLW